MHALINPSKFPSVNPRHLEQWLGAEAVRGLEQSTKDWYGPKGIAIAGVPGAVYAHRGSFYGKLKAGSDLSAEERLIGILKRVKRASRVTAMNQKVQTNAGFSSLGDLISEATAGGKKQPFGPWSKTTSTVTSVGRHMCHWRLGQVPAAAAVASNAPGGNIPLDSTQGAWAFSNPTGGDTLHLVSAWINSTIQSNVLLYDRIFEVNKLASSTATEAVTGVPTRYTNQTVGAVDHIGGNFCAIECQVALGATGHNWTVCQYTDQAGGTANNFASMTGVSACVVAALDHVAAENWFLTLAAGDTGVKALTQMQCSASVTGTICFFMGHPIAMMPNAVANVVTMHDYVNTAFSMERIFDDAALTTMDVWRPAAAGGTHGGMWNTVAG